MSHTAVGGLPLHELGFLVSIKCDDVDPAGVESVSSTADPSSRLLPEARSRSVNSGVADSNAEDTLSVFMNDELYMEDDLVDFGSIEELAGSSDLFGFRNIRPETATSGTQATGPQATSSENNSVCKRSIFS